MANDPSILDFFYNHISTEEWDNGLDLYQSDRAAKVSTVEGFITGRVTGDAGRSFEVRIKIHPSGHQIQWLECTCKRNRKEGELCEHITAIIIHLDRDRPEILASLNKTMPIKMLPSRKRAAEIKLGVPKTAESAKTLLLSHFEKGIQKISLVAKGPNLKIAVDIKEDSDANSFELGIDEAAAFLKKHPGLAKNSKQAKHFALVEKPAFLALFAREGEGDHLSIERVVAVEHTPHSVKKAAEIAGKTASFERAHRVSGPEQVAPAKLYEIIPVKSLKKNIGASSTFRYGIGYNLFENFSAASWHELPYKQEIQGDAAAALVSEHFRSLLEHGPLLIDESLNQAQVVEEMAFSKIQIHDQKSSWFSLDPLYQTGSESISMVDLIKKYRENKSNYHKHKGKWYRIPEMIKDFEWKLDDSGQFVEVDQLGLLRIQAAAGDLDAFAGSAQSLNALRNKLDFNHETTPPTLEHTKLNLRTYQSEGLAWFWWLYQNSLHGLLADEMGLGKTHQAMALMAAIHKTKPDAKFLVVSPTSVLDHWFDKMNDFCPSLKPIIQHGAKRETRLMDIGVSYNCVVTSYGICLRDLRHLKEIAWDAVILDEAHFVKNNDTATHQAVCQIPSQMRVCLTGTPMENHLLELKSIFDFLLPGYLGSDRYFRRRYLKGQDEEQQDLAATELQRLIHPFKLRRNKSEVLTDLPEKVEDIRHCELSPKQAAMYRETLELKAKPMLEELTDDSKPVAFLHVFAILTLLKQICNHPSLITGEGYADQPSGKFELLKELLSESLESGHKVVIYSQYVGMIQLISNYLKDQNIGFVTLTGQTQKRGKVIENFQKNPDIKIFVGSLMAGGIGIDLTAASVVIHYDRWWNASKENQATDRVHRIGQNKNVQVLKLVTRGTLEEKIHQMIQAKQKIFEKFLDRDEETFKHLSRGDLIDLLG